MQKGLAFRCIWSGSVAVLECQAHSEILPRRLHSRDGASVVRRKSAANRRRISMPKSMKKRPSGRKTPSAVSKKSPAKSKPTSPRKEHSATKQSRAIAMLRLDAGATIPGLMKATGWQPHSVRGFLAGVVRKKLKLKLRSTMVDGLRVYRIGHDNGVEASGKRPKRRAA
jgi:uncharacterized protein DUF3489